MTISIVKNDNFETVGFRASTSDDKCLFSWGVYPSESLYFIKKINGSKYEKEVAQLIQLDGNLDVLKNFMDDFFEIAKDNKMLKEGQGVNLSLIDEKKKHTLARMERIINSIK